MLKTGKIKRIIGAVVDIEFENHLPPILNALIYQKDDLKVVMEVVQHIGENRVRALAMDNLEGVKRGEEVVDTEAL